MNQILLKSIKSEFDTTDITRDELLQKYDLEDKDLPQWSKPPVVTGDIITSPTTNPAPLPEETDTVVKDIKNLKLTMLGECKKLVDGGDLEVKEMKEITSIILNIEDSMKDKGGNNPDSGVTVYIQNLVSNYKDDC